MGHFWYFEKAILQLVVGWYQNTNNCVDRLWGRNSRDKEKEEFETFVSPREGDSDVDPNELRKTLYQIMAWKGFEGKYL
jgi:hypothetical protein